MLESAIAKLEALDLGEVSLRVVRGEANSTLIPLNIDQLFERGIDSKGQSLGEYSPFTISYKKKKGQRYDHVTLRDEGDFYEGFFADADSWPVGINSKDSKTGELTDKYGDDIFGLTKDSTDELNEQIREELIEACQGAILACVS